jgi:hypothetical protein
MVWDTPLLYPRNSCRILRANSPPDMLLWRATVLWYDGFTPWFRMSLNHVPALALVNSILSYSGYPQVMLWGSPLITPWTQENHANKRGQRHHWHSGLVTGRVQPSTILFCWRIWRDHVSLTYLSCRIRSYTGITYAPYILFYFVEKYIPCHICQEIILMRLVKSDEPFACHPPWMSEEWRWVSSWLQGAKQPRSR